MRARMTTTAAAIAAAVLLQAGTVRAAATIELAKSVDVPVPAPGQAVEFQVTVRSTGDAVADAVIVRDPLPGRLEIPDGMAAFASTGAWDAATGDWMVGALAPGEFATLVVPAVITDPATPGCIANRASATWAGGPENPATAQAIVRTDAAIACADLQLDETIHIGALLLPQCDREDRYRGTVTVYNDGPDAAPGVVVELLVAVPPAGVPDVVFDDADCLGAAGSLCEIGRVEPGAGVEIDVSSALFQSYSSFTQAFELQVFSESADHDPLDNVLQDAIYGWNFSSCDFALVDVPDLDLGNVAPPACFIATAAYGSPLDRHVGTLREFRDDVLMRHGWGRAFVRSYYRHSPPLAAYIADRPALRALARAFLAPVVLLVAYPGRAAAVLAGLVLLIVMRILLALRRRRCAAA